MTAARVIATPASSGHQAIQPERVAFFFFLLLGRVSVCEVMFRAYRRVPGNVSQSMTAHLTDHMREQNFTWFSREGEVPHFSVSLPAPQNRHPDAERLTDYRLTQRCGRGVEGPDGSYLSMLLVPFQPREPENRSCCGTYLMVTGDIFSCTVIIQQVRAVLVPGKVRSARFVVEKVRAAWVNTHRRGPSLAPQALRHAINL